jgi:hypothetical protein
MLALLCRVFDLHVPYALVNRFQIVIIGAGINFKISENNLPRLFRGAGFHRHLGPFVIISVLSRTTLNLAIATPALMS